MNVKLLTEHHLEFLLLKGGCTGSSESTHVKMPHCWFNYLNLHYNEQMLFQTFQIVKATRSDVIHRCV